VARSASLQTHGALIHEYTPRVPALIRQGDPGGKMTSELFDPSRAGAQEGFLVSHRTASMAAGLAFLAALGAVSAPARDLPRQRKASQEAVREDLRRILEQAGKSQDWIGFELSAPSTDANRVTVNCLSADRIVLEVSAVPPEWSSTFYHGLQRLGFLFPHPRIQISPEPEEARAHCGKTYAWEPRVRYRGFHLHTPHPNEWVPGFFGEEAEIARDTIRWLARNGQNAVEVRLLRTAYPELIPPLQEAIGFAHEFGIYFGLGVTFSHIQQKAFHLISPLRATLGIGAEENLRRRLDELLEAFEFDYMLVALGTSEFTSTKATRTLDWINTASRVLRSDGRQLFVAAHVSTGQEDKELGNFNYLAQHGESDVGIFAHTVMFYGLEDRRAPVYGRSDFSDLRQLMAKEGPRRPLWYYPETSYFIGMDIDVPLLLTDYLVARSADYDYISDQGVAGHMTFTTGHELGYWLMDWSVALFTQKRFAGEPMAALELLGEDSEVWGEIIAFQTEHFKENQLISILSGATLLDELPQVFHGAAHERTLLRRLAEEPELRRAELQKLETALQQLPSTSGIRNEELRVLLNVTWKRILHAYCLRQALEFCTNCPERKDWLRQAARFRTTARAAMDDVAERFNRYPSARIFDEHGNVTGYNFGYGWPAVQLHFWEREERMIEQNRWTPWFMNIYEIFGVVF
ncbi:MAG: hypothetical protein MI920_02685, partial [Kiloniellales bacterium]|nr:hypothetical protein [Kiloniellales bacterium]